MFDSLSMQHVSAPSVGAGLVCILLHSQVQSFPHKPPSFTPPIFFPPAFSSKLNSLKSVDFKARALSQAFRPLQAEITGHSFQTHLEIRWRICTDGCFEILKMRQRS